MFQYQALRALSLKKTKENVLRKPYRFGGDKTGQLQNTKHEVFCDNSYKEPRSQLTLLVTASNINPENCNRSNCKRIYKLLHIHNYQ